MSSISFDNVYLLFIAIPLVLLLAVPFFLAVRKDNVNGHNIASFVIHVLMAGLIALSAAGTQFVTVMTETDVYVVADVSYSASKNLSTVDSYILNVRRELPKNTRLGVICFGKDYQLLTKLGENLKSVSESDVDSSETDIVKALDYAGSLFKDTVIKRIVLITDGKETDTHDSNALKREIESLNDRGIRVDAIYLDDNISDTAKEVQVTNLEYTSNAYLDHSETVNAVIQSSCAANAIVSLYRGDEKLEEKAVTVSRGSSYVSFGLDTSESGVFDYEVRITAEGDENPYNNSCYFTQNVSGSVNLLFISDSYDDYDALPEMFGETANIDAYIKDPNVPCSIEALCKYDEILISNADVSKLNNSTLFLESLETVVSMFGKSLITLGDTEIQNKTDGVLKPLEDMLPVKYGNSENDSKLYTIVIDCSRSMETLFKFQTAKRAACNLIDMLNNDDSVCVVTFYGDVRIVQKPVQVGSVSEVLKQTINDLEAAQGTFIGLGLSETLDLIKNSSYGEKQLMLISDGVSYTDETDNPIDIINQMRAYGITCSVLDVGRGSDNGSEAVKAKQLLENIASTGQGNYYYAPSPEAADNVIFGDIAADVKETKIERYSWVTIKKRFDEVVSDIDDASYIAGFMNSTAKASATTVLTTDYQNASGIAIEVPIYSYWNYGNGKVAAFTSNVSGNWLSAWRQSGLKRQFFGNVLETLTPAEKIDYPFTVEITNDRGAANVKITPATIRAEANATIKVTSPSQTELGGNLVFDSSCYGYSFAATDVGRYTVTVSYSYGGEQYTAETGFTISYLSEYDSFAVYDSSVLHRAIGSNGTVSEEGIVVIEHDQGEVRTRTVTLIIPLLIICVVLFAVDIVIRKLKWNDIKSLFIRVK